MAKKKPIDPEIEKITSSPEYKRLVRTISRIIQQYQKIKPKINIKKVAKGLGAEIVTDPKKIAEMKKKARPWRPE